MSEVGAMKVQYEKGDIVEVMDDVSAGPAAACTVELKWRCTDNEKSWVCKDTGSWPGSYNRALVVEERFFISH